MSKIALKRTLVLCDLFERIWGHDLKKRESKSPLWAHLMAYGEVLCRQDTPPHDEIRRSITPDILINIFSILMTC